MKPLHSKLVLYKKDNLGAKFPFTQAVEHQKLSVLWLFEITHKRPVSSVAIHALITTTPCATAIGLFASYA